MLEKIFSKIITRYLKQYIQTLDRNQLEMKIWKGHAKFENLNILKTAFSYHNIPLLVKKGTIGTVEINFPWKNLSNESCSVEIRDVYIFAQIDLSVLIQGDLNARNQVNLHFTSSNNSINQEASNEEKIGAWQSFINTIIDNMRINIRNIHLCIEYQGQIQSFSFGFFLPLLTLITVDENNNPLPKVSRSSIIRKQFKIQNMSIYLDVGSSNINLNNFQEEMFKQMDVNENSHQFILVPFSIDINFIHNRNKDTKIKNDISISLPQISILLDFLQCRALNDLNKTWNLFSKRRKFAHCHRPNNFNQFSDVWKYLHRCAISKTQFLSFNQNLAHSFLSNKTKYLKLYRKATNSKVKVPFAEQKLNKFESKLYFGASALLRQYSEAIIEKENSDADSILTSLDVSELKGIGDNSDVFFSSSSLAISFIILSTQFEIAYSKNNPLLKIYSGSINGTLNSLETGAESILTINSFHVIFFHEKKAFQLFEASYENKNFLTIQSLNPSGIPNNSLEIIIEPIKFLLIPNAFKIIYQCFQFSDYNSFQISSNINSNINSTTEKENNVQYVDVFDQLRGLLSIKNQNIKLTLKKITFILTDESIPIKNTKHLHFKTLQYSNLQQNHSFLN